MHAALHAALLENRISKLAMNVDKKDRERIMRLPGPKSRNANGILTTMEESEENLNEGLLYLLNNNNKAF